MGVGVEQEQPKVPRRASYQKRYSLAEALLARDDRLLEGDRSVEVMLAYWHDVSHFLIFRSYLKDLSEELMYGQVTSATHRVNLPWPQP